MIDIALVSYINTRPFMDGFEAKIKDREIRFHLLPPVDCATHLHQGKCQMALLPVGALAQFKNISIMPNYCIGADVKGRWQVATLVWDLADDSQACFAIVPLAVPRYSRGYHLPKS